MAPETRGESDLRRRDHPHELLGLAALSGEERTVRLEGEFSQMFLRVAPLTDEAGEIVGCVSILNSAG